MLEEFELPRTQLPALPGEPVVLGVAESWGELSRGALEQLRAELEPLGAALLLISSRELVCVRPGAPRGGVVRSSRVRQLWPSNIGPWHRAPAANAPTASTAGAGPGCASTRRCAPTLAVVDEHGIVRWLQRSAAPAAPLELLHAALAQARQHLCRPQRLASGARTHAAVPFSNVELSAGLCEAMTATFGAGDEPGSPEALGQSRAQRSLG